MDKKNKGGRPCKNPGKIQADSVIHVYVTPAQYRRCVQAAVKAGLSLSGWVEKCIWWCQAGGGSPF